MTNRRGRRSTTAATGTTGATTHPGPPSQPLWPRIALALAASAVPLGLAPFLEHPERAAETAYLGTLTALLLLALAALPPRRRGNGLGGIDPLAPTALLAVLAVVALPPDPVRGVSVLALLAAGIALAAGRHPGHPARRWTAEVAFLTPLAVAVQVLFRSEGLLAPRADLHTLLVYAALPAAAAGAAALLAVRRGRPAALIAAATAVVVGGGLGAASTLALLALAAGEILARPPLAARHGWRAAALLTLLAPFAWQQRSAVLALLTAALVAALPARLERLRASSLAILAPAALVALAGAVLFPLRGWQETAPSLGLAILVLPLLPWSLLRDGRRDLRSLTAAVVAAVADAALVVAAARCAPDPSSLALPLAFLALLVAGGGQGSQGVALQGAWSTLLTAAAALIAAYPWLRPEPVWATVALFRLDVLGWSTLAVVLLATAAALWPPRAPFRRIQAPVLLGLLLFHALPSAPLPHQLIEPPGVELSAKDDVWEIDFGTTVGSGPSISALVARSHLSFTAPLTRGTPVFDLLLFAGDGAPVDRWTFRVGRETDEWAAGRADVRARLGRAVPPHHLAWVASGGSFFGRTYRAHRELTETVTPTRLVLRRRPELPRPVTVHLQRLEAIP